MTSNLEDHIERLAIMAAVLEVSTSPKPGNVHRYRLGIPKMEPDEFIPQSFNFCKAIRSQTSK